MADAYTIKRKDVFLGRELKYGEPSAQSFLRLARRGSGVWTRPVHEIWVTDQPPVPLKNALVHTSVTSVSQFTDKINNYARINADFLFRSSVRSSWWDIVLYPTAKFVQNYVVLRGYRDGVHGFMHAVFMSMHSFLTRATLWLLWDSHKWNRTKT